MNFKRVFTWAGLIAGGALAVSAMPAQASTFDFAGQSTANLNSHSFNFTSTVSGNPDTNQMLTSVQYGGHNYLPSNMLLVNGATIVHNQAFDQFGHRDGMSADKGVGATVGLNVESPTEADVVGALGNLNINSIIDTEDRASSVLEVTFAQAARNFLFWERGRNSKMVVEALDAVGSVIGRYLLDSSTSQNAGFLMKTAEIGYGQSVGTVGINFGQATSRLRLISMGSSFNGADFKVMAAVPEPMTMTGTALAAGAFFAARRKKRKQSAEA